MTVPDPERGKEGRITGEETPFGFRWGPLEIRRAVADDNRGMVVATIKTKKHRIDVYAMKGGKVRIFEDNKEWKNPRRGGEG